MKASIEGRRTGTSGRALAGLGLLGLTLAAAGCGGERLSYNDKVEGVVLMDGAPLPGVRVEFLPEQAGPKAPTSSGFTDGKGRFALTYGDQKPGAVIARHRVVVLAGRTSPAGDEREATPARTAAVAVPQVYAVAAQTPLRVEITPDQHTYEVKLTRNPPPPR